MSEDHFGGVFAKSFGMFLNGETLTAPHLKSERIVDDSFYLMFNAHHEGLIFKLPEGEYGK
jgi:glycogen operon protein